MYRLSEQEMQMERPLPVTCNTCNASATDQSKPLFMFLTSRFLSYRAAVWSLAIEALSLLAMSTTRKLSPTALTQVLRPHLSVERFIVLFFWTVTSMFYPPRGWGSPPEAYSIQVPQRQFPLIGTPHVSLLVRVGVGIPYTRVGFHCVCPSVLCPTPGHSKTLEQPAV